MQCSEAGTWSGVTTRCGAASCGQLSPPKFGSIKCSDDDRFGSLCELSCDKGYELVGSSERVCQSNHVWSGVTSLCNLVQCDVMIPPRDGLIDCSNGHLFDSVCNFECKTGYNLEGKKKSKCLNTKQWSNAAPTCSIQMCTELKAPLHSSIRCTDNNRYESQCTIFCKLGHELTSYNEVTCSANGEWMVPAGEGFATYPVDEFKPDSCKKIQCPKLDSLENGKSSCTDENSYDSLCRFTCDPGYDLIGSRARRCQFSGQWSGVGVSCQKITCPTFKLLDVIQIQCQNSSTTAQTVCKFEPEEGYRLIGADRVVCLPTGQWSDNFPTAELIECPSDMEILHGVSDCSKTNKYGSVCEYVCRAGYELSGNSRRKCMADGKWNRKKPTCELATCRPLAVPEHGRMYGARGEIRNK